MDAGLKNQQPQLRRHLNQTEKRICPLEWPARQSPNATYISPTSSRLGNPQLPQVRTTTPAPGRINIDPGRVPQCQEGSPAAWTTAPAPGRTNIAPGRVTACQGGVPQCQEVAPQLQGCRHPPPGRVTLRQEAVTGRQRRCHRAPGRVTQRQESLPDDQEASPNRQDTLPRRQDGCRSAWS
ncbi:hypothetical protein P886_0421 [Alteromonadaceae bacterium 2753L.S.0a.02]|nr:hypothetical protein P886_0421 [Alteromonadaceae bacterium 2753L.S.0a.02]